MPSRWRSKVLPLELSDAAQHVQDQLAGRAGGVEVVLAAKQAEALTAEIRQSLRNIPR